MASEEERDFRPWSDLPIDILELIVSKLPCFHHPYFVSVCKSWSQVDIPSVSPIRSPLLLHNAKRGNDICRYYDPSTNMTFIVDCPFDLSGYEFYFARDGWLLLHKEYEVVLVNPITGIFRKFPLLFNHRRFTAFIFTGSPPHDCKLYGIVSTIYEMFEITIWDNNEWVVVDEFDLFDYNHQFVAAQFSNLVCHKNLIYCLGSEGNLGVYDPTEETWTVLTKPTQFDIYYKYSYLVESEEELVVVLIEDNGMPIHIYRLDQSEMQWVKIKTLKDQSLFVESRMSLLTTTLARRMRNHVYLPRVHGVAKTCMAEVKSYQDRLFFVSKERDTNKRPNTCSIYSFSLENNECSKFYGSREFMYSIWFEPKLT